MGKVEAGLWIEQVKRNLPQSPSLLNDGRLFNQRCKQLIDMLKAAQRDRGMPDGEGGPED